jgi:hypothetical protein
VVIPLRCADVVSGAEVVARAAQHDDGDVVVLDGPLEGGVQGVGHDGVLCVAVPRSVHRDDSDTVTHPVSHYVLVIEHRVIVDRRAHDGRHGVR